MFTVFLFTLTENVFIGRTLLTSGSAPDVVTWLLSVTAGFMVSWTMNQVAFLRMNAEIRFQWMMFLRQRILLQHTHTHTRTHTHTHTVMLCRVDYKQHTVPIFIYFPRTDGQ